MQVSITFTLTMPLVFHKADISFRMPKATAIKGFVTAQFKKETKKALDLSCVFCSDEFVLDINKRFLDHDYYTDIITFPLDDTDKKTTAELYISIGRVKENATTLGISFEKELHRVIFHGVLHLCGYGDKTKKEIALMRQKEDEWLDLFYKLAQ
jgi:probable rRNA maturation factor